MLSGIDAKKDVKIEVEVVQVDRSSKDIYKPQPQKYSTFLIHEVQITFAKSVF